MDIRIMNTTFSWPKTNTNTNTIMTKNSFARSLSLAALHCYLEASTKDHYCHPYFSGFLGNIGNNIYSVQPFSDP